ncbi:MAG: hypothetical protein II713_06090 [Clostridia bacterium]|nr:hypothetical protein [Clostridia bacterium]
MANDKSLRDDWKEVGKGLGKSVIGLGKSIYKSAKVGAEKVEEWADDDKDGTKIPQDTGLRESWSEVGHTLGATAAGLGKAIVRSAKAGAQKADEWAEKDEEPKTETLSDLSGEKKE